MAYTGEWRGAHRLGEGAHNNGAGTSRTRTEEGVYNKSVCTQKDMHEIAQNQFHNVTMWVESSLIKGS
jgi:hypothetical protein